LLKVGLIQMRCEKDATAENLESTSRYLAEAVARDGDIVGFPEMSITGYADPTRYPEAILHLDGPEVAQVVEMTRGQPVTLLAGLIEANPRANRSSPTSQFAMVNCWAAIARKRSRTRKRIGSRRERRCQSSRTAT